MTPFVSVHGWQGDSGRTGRHTSLVVYRECRHSELSRPLQQVLEDTDVALTLFSSLTAADERYGQVPRQFGPSLIRKIV